MLRNSAASQTPVDPQLGRVGRELQEREDVAFDVEVARDVRPGDPELARTGDDTSDGVRRTDDHGGRRVGRARATAVVRLYRYR